MHEAFYISIILREMNSQSSEWRIFNEEKFWKFLLNYAAYFYSD